MRIEDIGNSRLLAEFVYPRVTAYLGLRASRSVMAISLPGGWLREAGMKTLVADIITFPACPCLTGPMWRLQICGLG